MITYKTGNIFGEDVEAIVNTVNCVGVMGRGIALQFKKAYPENFRAYAAACANNAVQPGHMFVHETRTTVRPHYIINFPTKRHWRAKSRLEDIEAGLVALVDEICDRNIRSLALPPLGAGLGGLDWKAVRQRIERALGCLEDVNIVVYEPLPSHETAPASKSATPPKMTPGRAALIVLTDRYLAGFLDPSVTLLELHKLMYFLQEAGEPLRLKYKKGLYGPYAENLRHVLNVLEGHFLTGYADGGDAPNKELTLMPEALADARAFLSTQRGHLPERLERVSELVDGFESSSGLELLSTVHWVCTRDQLKHSADVIDAVHSWNYRKRRFTERQIRIALDSLGSKGWIEPPQA